MLNAACLQPDFYSIKEISASVMTRNASAIVYCPALRAKALARRGSIQEKNLNKFVF